MAYDGNGGYSPPAPQFPAIPGNVIYAEDFNTIIADLAAALSKALLRDGQAPMIAPLDLGGNLLKNGQLDSTVTVPTLAPGTNTNQPASMAALLQQAFLTALPNQAGQDGKWIQTNKGVASWQTPPIDLALIPKGII